MVRKLLVILMGMTLLTALPLAQAHAADSSISGTVWGPDGWPLGGVTVSTVVAGATVTTTADDGGAFVLTVPPSATGYEVTFTAPHAPTLTLSSGPVPDGGTVTLDPELYWTTTLTGTVTNAATGSPLSNADVILYLPNDLSREGVRTDAAGHYSTTVTIDPWWSRTLLVRASGFVNYEAPAPTLVPNETTVQDMALTPIRPSTGTIVDVGTGLPLAGATLSARLDTGQTVTTVSDADGKWSLNLPLGTTTVYLSLPQYRPGYLTCYIDSANGCDAGIDKMILNWFAPTDPQLIGTMANQVGTTFSISQGPWQATPDAITYQWLRDGVPVTGATSSTYLVTEGDAGHDVSAVETATRAGYPSLVISASPIHIPHPFLAVPVLSIAGKAKNGQQLTATFTGAWSPVPTAITYQWYRGVDAIPGAASATYKVTKADVGRPLFVKAVATNGYFDPVGLAASVSVTQGN